MVAVLNLALVLSIDRAISFAEQAAKESIAIAKISFLIVIPFILVGFITRCLLGIEFVGDF